MNYTAWIEVPGHRDGSHFTMIKETDDIDEARRWLAHQVGANPCSEGYGIDDNVSGETVHLCGTMR